MLAQLGCREGRPFADASVPLAVESSGASETHEVVAALAALGHLHDPRGLLAVLDQVQHPDDGVRFHVAVALPSVAGHPPADAAVAALIRLTSDPDPEVRDWATFGLGTQIELDTSAVRTALAARIDDGGGDTSGEALRGLAVRHDPRAIESVRHRLQDPECDDLIVEAAAALGSPVLLPELRRLKDDGWDQHVQGNWLDRAIEACSGRR